MQNGTFVVTEVHLLRYTIRCSKILSALSVTVLHKQHVVQMWISTAVWIHEVHIDQYRINLDLLSLCVELH